MRAFALWCALSVIAAPLKAESLPKDFEKKVDAIFSDYDGPHPGCAIGVYRSGYLVFGKGYGLANLGTGEKITKSTLFNVASLSKQFTAFAIALLEREGRISLDAEVQTYVPELPKFAAPITVRHLVHHTSGLRDYGALLELTGWRIDQPLSRPTVLALLQRQRGLNYNPGSRYEYNNTNYLLLALIIERVSGRSLADFSREQIFAPLSMSRTLFRDNPENPPPERALNYTRLAENARWTLNHVWDRPFALGGFGVHTSIEDLAKWDRNFIAPSVGDGALIQTLLAPSALSSGERLSYGFGLDLSPYRGLRAVSHGGQGGGTFHYLQLPDQQLSVATFCNRYSLGLYATDSAVLTWEVIDLLLDPSSDAMFSDPVDSSSEIPMSPSELEKFVGDYWRHAGAPIRIRLQNRQLVELLEGKADRLIPVQASRFRSPDGKAIYDFSDKDGSRVLTYREPLTNLIVLGERRRTWSPSTNEVAGATGRYCTEEVPVCWSLLSRGKSVTLRRVGFPDRVLEPAWEDTFTLVEADNLGTRSMRLNLRRMADGSVIGFNLSRGRVTNLVFLKQ